MPGLAADGQTLLRVPGSLTLGRILAVGRGIIVNAGLSLKEAALLDRAAAVDLACRAGAGTAMQGRVVEARGAAGAAAGGVVLAALLRGGGVGDVLGDGVLRANGGGVDAVALAGLGHGVVAAVKVLALLQMLGEVVGLGGELAVQAEQALLLGRERADVNLVLLVRIHLVDGHANDQALYSPIDRRVNASILPTEEKKQTKAYWGAGSGMPVIRSRGWVFLRAPQGHDVVSESRSLGNRLWR